MNCKIRLTVSYHGHPNVVYACIDLDPIMEYAFEPLKTGDDPLVMMITGEVMHDSPIYQKVMKIRKNAADELAFQLSHFLIDEMGKGDTFNGYPLVK